MSNPKFTLEDAVIVQKHLRLRARMTQPISQDVTASYEIVESVLGRMTEKTWRVGHYVAECGQLKPIPGAISKYVDGKGVVEVPLNTEPEVLKTLGNRHERTIGDLSFSARALFVNLLNHPLSVRRAGRGWKVELDDRTL